MSSILRSRPTSPKSDLNVTGVGLSQSPMSGRRIERALLVRGDRGDPDGLPGEADFGEVGLLRTLIDVSRGTCLAGLLFVVLLATSCATRGPADATPPVPPVALEFAPASFVSPINLDSGAYGNLFAPDSYAVWVGPDVAALKRAHAAEAGEPVDPALEAASGPFNDNFLVFECHLASAFPDMSIGYDAVGLRRANVYLLTDDGRVIPPVQTLMAGPIRETQQGAIRKFERVNLVVFPRKDLNTGMPTVNSAAPAVRLAVEAVRTKFYFEWASALNPAQPGPPTIEDRLRAVKLGFNEFYRKLMSGAHTFD